MSSFPPDPQRNAILGQFIPKHIQISERDSGKIRLIEKSNPVDVISKLDIVRHQQGIKIRSSTASFAELLYYTGTQVIEYS